ncbi:MULTISPECIES: hypothetical protein [Bradyrhizobium]|uniref:Type VI secretion system VasI, EvfG, VC_A0118 n=2 Tax=Bradyrhizobium TaxID=374 RepID=A0AAE7NRD0_9BRAD|nr:MULTISPECIES: hypothetical protein [Bradyrhizobium]QOG20718.1 hypothetical protein FOM02_28560 [Bradyrhizobium sp. SEMIA]QOZ68133.1 hypothetical protein WN72_18855 [Bradyrhizobium arachidis]UFW52804.1 type VI secretion protein [Bradyrhizobium arachidis]
MTRIAAPFLIATAVINGVALAQGMEDPMAQLRACSQMGREARLECFDKLSQTPAPSRSEASRADNWMISETTSPVDYSPIVTATASPRAGSAEPSMKLSIRCRAGRTEMSFAGNGISGAGDHYLISYRINGGQPVQVAAIVPTFGSGVAIAGDIVGLLHSLPNNADLMVRLSSPAGVAHEATFSLSGLDTMRARMAAICKWPRSVARPAVENGAR